MKIGAFRQLVWDFYGKNKRAMPWRETSDPYRIVVSEIMLQQTQVSRVMEKYPIFIKVFPDFQALAKASVLEVLKVWQGLGYNRRALNLKRLSEIVVRDFGGKLPRDPEALESLPGIGKATAGSIPAFAFNEPTVFIETNIRRAFLHHFFPGKTKVDDEKIVPFVAEALDTENPREWYWALFDYGSWLAKEVPNPNRRHSAYKKQSKFVGSSRQLRGAIVRALLASPKAPVSILAKALGKTTSEIQKTLKELKKEGFTI